MEKNFIYVIDYGDYWEGSCADHPLVFSSSLEALVCAREKLEKVRGISPASAYCIVREYVRPNIPGQPWEYTQVCMVHKDEEWVA